MQGHRGHIKNLELDHKLGSEKYVKDFEQRKYHRLCGCWLIKSSQQPCKYVTDMAPDLQMKIQIIITEI